MCPLICQPPPPPARPPPALQVTVIAMLDAISALLTEGYQPQRTLMFGFGQDEEVGGACGAGEGFGVLEGLVSWGVCLV